MEKKTILVVDDEEHVRQFIKASLLEEYNVLEATSGTEALSVMQNTQPDLVILDWMMPHLDGIGVLEQMRQNPKTSSIPVLMLTAKGTTHDMVVGITTGADDFMRKPFAIKELLERVQKLLQEASQPTQTKELGDQESNLPNEEAFNAN